MTFHRLVNALGLFAVLGLGIALSACNTIEGAGEDVSAAGSAVTKSAEKTKQAL